MNFLSRWSTKKNIFTPSHFIETMSFWIAPLEGQRKIIEAPGLMEHWRKRIINRYLKRF